MLINGYNTSTDYEALFELVKNQNIICYAMYNRLSFVDDPIWDPCEAIVRSALCPCYELVSRGHRYFSVNTKEEFLEKCQQFQVRFVLPTQSQVDLAPSLLELFLLVIFETSEALHAKAKELNCVPFKGAEDIQYLHHIASKMYKNGHKLFYFKKAFSTKELEHLVCCDDYHEVKDKPNIYINGNHNTGVLYVVENLVKEE